MFDKSLPFVRIERFVRANNAAQCRIEALAFFLPMPRHRSVASHRQRRIGRRDGRRHLHLKAARFWRIFTNIILLFKTTRETIAQLLYFQLHQLTRLLLTRL